MLNLPFRQGILPVRSSFYKRLKNINRNKMEPVAVLAFMGLGGQEMLLIGMALLLLFGAKKIPELMRGLGQGIKEFKNATKDVKDSIEKSMDVEDTQK